MRHLRLLFIVLLATLSFSSCDQAMAPLSSTPPPSLSPQARAYLTQALDDMQQHSVNRKQINWTALRQEAFAEASHAKTPADTYSAIVLALSHLADHHSFFVRLPRPPWLFGVRAGSKPVYPVRTRCDSASRSNGNLWLDRRSTQQYGWKYVADACRCWTGPG